MAPSRPAPARPRALGGECRFDGGFAPPAAATLDRKAGLAHDRANEVEVVRLAAERTVEIHNVEPGRAGVAPVARDGERVTIEDLRGSLGSSGALWHRQAMAAEQVNRGVEDHAGATPS